MTILIIVLIYAMCSFLAWGLTLGDFTREYPMSPRGKGTARVMATLGPMGLMAALIAANRPYTFLLKPHTKEQRWTAFQIRFSSTDRDIFEAFYGK